VANELILRLGADSSALSSGLRKSEVAINSFSGKTRATFTRLSTSIRGVADKAITPLTGIMLGGGLGVAVSAVGDLSQSLMYYGMSAKKSDKDTAALRKSLHQMAMDTGVDADQILAGMSKIGEITGDFGLGEKMGLNLAKASKASQASIEDLATVASSMNVSFGWGAEQIQQAFNSLIVQGDAGSYTLKGFATEGKALLAAASSFGIKSTDQFASFGAYLQVMNTSIKSEAELTTSVSALFSELIGKQKELKKIGIKVFDADGSIKNFDVIMRELMAATDGNIKKISPMFGESARKALIPIMGEYKKGWTTLESITTDGMKAITNTDELDKRFTKTSNDFNTNIGKMKASAVAFADENLSGPIDTLSDSLKFLSEHQEIVSAGFKMIAVSVAALTAIKIGGFIGQIRGLAGDLTQIWKGGSTSSPTSAAIDSVQKVFVTNMSGGFGGASDYYDDLPSKLPMATSKIDDKWTKNFSDLGGGGGFLKSTKNGVLRFDKAFARVTNKLFGNALGFSALSIATGIAADKIMEAGGLLLEYFDTRAKTMEESKAHVDSLSPSMKKYGSSAEMYSKQIDAINLAIQEEETSFWVNEDKLNKLFEERSRAMKNMSTSIKNRSSDENYKKNLAAGNGSQYLPNQNIYINFDGLNASVKTTNGKAPKVHSTKPLAGRA